MKSKCVYISRERGRVCVCVFRVKDEEGEYNKKEGKERVKGEPEYTSGMDHIVSRK